MDVNGRLRSVVKRAQRLLDEVIKPQIFSDHVLLDVAVHQSTNPIPHAQAVKGEYKPVQLGFEWGPVWSTAWFRLRGQVPAAWAGREWRVLFDTDTEALCWWDGGPYQGVEFHRQDVKLPESVKPGQALEVFMEAACNHMFGLSTMAGPEHSGTFMTRMGGKLKQAHLALFHPKRHALLVDMDMLRMVAHDLPEESPRGRQVRDGLRRACNVINPANLDACIDEALSIIHQTLNVPTGGEANTAYCVGHAHIDLGWLWPVRETKRKCSRTFSTVLRYMERHPQYRFLQSQAQAYEWVRTDYPTLFEGIKQSVARGQWEAGGAMWVEADCNLSSGEALIRQIMHGTRFWKQHFNVEQRYLWLPDVFGYSAALPQILKQSGLDAFITQKISWNQFNKFPHHTFHWVGIDGTSILSHFLPADTYNARNTPDEFLRGDRNDQQNAVAPMWLQAFGYGDGGGGPTEEMIRRVDRLANCAGLPRAQHSRVDHFVDKLLQTQEGLPRWIGELYLELHRGTYTTQARNKRYNRLCERLLQDVEQAMALSDAAVPEAERAELDRLWKLLLLNQFHDIIPGSSITWVYEDSLREYAEIVASANKLIDAAAARTQSSNGKAGWAALNSVTHATRAVVELPQDHGLPGGALPTQNIRDIEGIDRTLALTAELPGPGLFKLDAAPAPGAVKVSGLTLENEIIRVELDRTGRVISLLDKRTLREAIVPGQPANQLMIYDDRPMNWDAWDIDAFYMENGQAVETEAQMRVVEQGPIRVAIEFTRKLGQASTITQRISVTAGSPILGFESLVDWKENFKFLRVQHPVQVHSDHATYEIQFGHVRRPNHFNTSWDYARFEVCAQRWMDLSETGFGVSLLNDCKYGHSCMGNVMGMSLLRSPNFPDPVADRAVHRFTYALMPHGHFDAGEITAAAQHLNNPVRVVKAGAASNSPAVALRGDHAGGIVIETIKPAEDGPGWVVRLWECRGGRGSVGLMFNQPARVVEETDLMEKVKGKVNFDGPVVPLNFTPFQIRTIKVQF